MSLQLTIDKLKGLDNYKAWSMTVRAYLEVEDLWSVVDNGPDGTDEVSFLKLIFFTTLCYQHVYAFYFQSLQKDKRAKFIILCLIEQKLCQFMVSIRTAKDLWAYLKKQHSLR